MKMIQLDNAVVKGSSNISLNKVKNDEGVYPLYSAKGFYKNISFFHQEEEYLAIIKDGAGIGRISIHPPKSSCVGTMQYLIPKEGFDIRFIRYCLLSIDFTKYSQGATIPHIYFKDYKSELIPKLSIEEQLKLVSKLDQAFEAIDQAIANTEKNIENFKELFNTSLEKSFNEVNTNQILDSYVEIKTGKLNANAMVKDGKYKFFTCSRETFNIDHFAYDCKAVLLAGNNASGDFNVKYYEGKFNAYQRTYIITIRDESQMCYGYLKYVLNNYLKVFKRMSVGANTRFLKIGMIKNVPLKLPPLNEQKRIIKELDSMNYYLDSLKDVSFKKRKAMDELKMSILEKAFKGELV